MRQRSNRGNGNAALWTGLGVAAGVMAGLWWWRSRRPEQPLPALPEAGKGTALVTGASSGIGEAYARRLAREGYDLILLARREERLRALADELHAQHGVSADVLPADLADPDAVARVAERIAATPTLTLLVNNAGFGIQGTFVTADEEEQLQMIRVNTVAPVRLTRAAAPGMVERQRGAIVNVSSMMAFFPLGRGTTYAATKAYLNAFTEALHQELAGAGVRVQALCPGFTRTEFHDAAGYESRDSMGLPDFVWMSPEAVVDQSLRDLRRGRVISIPGPVNRLVVALRRFVPRSWIYAAGRWSMRQEDAGQQQEDLGGFRKRTYASLADFREDLRFIRANRGKMRRAMVLLDPGFRERMMLAVTQVNGCRYCAYQHARLALKGGLTQEEIDALLAGVVDDCPSEEATGVVYAQHWAESCGCPDPEAREQLVAVYSEERAEAIEMVLRVITMGNYTGNTFDYFLYRISGGRWGE